MKRYHDQERCAHCGQVARGYARLNDGERVCHGEAGPDCYRRVTVYGERLGILAGLAPEAMPHGVAAVTVA